MPSPPIHPSADEDIGALEATLWEQGCPDHLLARYQARCRERETALAEGGGDQRPDFLVVIPVADRPRQLENCLDSLLQQCRLFGYGGRNGDSYRKVRALVADDSAGDVNRDRIRDLCHRVTAQGLNTEYFGQDAQWRALDALPKARRQALRRIVGERDRTGFHHKGASITRNITALRLAQWARERPGTLFWFMDSDQAFQIDPGNGRGPLHAIDYFHQLARIFTTTQTRLLTGKVVGDPPVSPAVMAGNFLRDVHAFLAELTGLAPAGDCRFHADSGAPADDAAYHDMADLFGFRPAESPARHACRLRGPHDHARCLQDFARRLDHFFDGEHPTRQTRYEYREAMASLQPARTVYTGNYVVHAEALADFIPFATLGLRMAGPVLGRILRAERAGAFVSANLPVLHRRALDATGRSEFRPGVERQRRGVDLGREFERQFYGDVMLFSIERLAQQGFPATTPAATGLERLLQEIESGLREKYAHGHARVRERLARLQTLFQDGRHWWHGRPDCTQACRDIQSFIDNMQNNFGEQATGPALIHDPEHRRQRLTAMREAILALPGDRANWRDTLQDLRQDEGGVEG